jgi:hypothetical protein
MPRPPRFAGVGGGVGVEPTTMTKSPFFKAAPVVVLEPSLNVVAELTTTLSADWPRVLTVIESPEKAVTVPAVPLPVLSPGDAVGV